MYNLNSSDIDRLLEDALQLNYWLSNDNKDLTVLCHLWYLIWDYNRVVRSNIISI